MMIGRYLRCLKGLRGGDIKRTWTSDLMGRHVGSVYELLAFRAEGLVAFHSAFT